MGKLSSERLEELPEDPQQHGDRPMPVAQVSASSGLPVASSPGDLLSPSALERHLPFHVMAKVRDLRF